MVQAYELDYCLVSGPINYNATFGQVMANTLAMGKCGRSNVVYGGKAQIDLTPTSVTDYPGLGERMSFQGQYYRRFSPSKAWLSSLGTNDDYRMYFDMIRSLRSDVLPVDWHTNPGYEYEVDLEQDYSSVVFVNALQVARIQYRASDSVSYTTIATDYTGSNIVKIPSKCRYIRVSRESSSVAGSYANASGVRFYVPVAEAVAPTLSAPTHMYLFPYLVSPTIPRSSALNTDFVSFILEPGEFNVKPPTADITEPTLGTIQLRYKP